MFIMLSMIVSARAPTGRVGIVPPCGLEAAGTRSSSAALRTLRRRAAQIAGGDPGRSHKACQAASEDWPYMNPTSCVGACSWPKCRTVALSAHPATRPPCAGYRATRGSSWSLARRRNLPVTPLHATCLCRVYDGSIGGVGAPGGAGRDERLRADRRRRGPATLSCSGRRRRPRGSLLGSRL